MVQHSLFDDLETQAGGAVTTTPRRVVQPTPGERAFWEDWKTRALAGFVVPYCQSLAASRLYRACWWIDGLASPGRSAGASAGSAALEASDVLAASGFTLRSLRLDAHPPRDQGQKATKLQPAPAGEGPAENGQKKRKTAANQPPAQEVAASASRSDLPELLGTAAAVLLLNPFGASPLTAEDLLPLCQRRANTELLLTISIAQVEHQALQSLADVGESEATPRPPDAPLPALTALFRSDSWKTIWTGEDTTAHKGARTIELLQGLLKPHFLYVCLAPLGDAPTPRHFLLFASRQYAGLVQMNDFLCAELARLAHEREAHTLQGDWFAKRRQKARAAAWAALKEEIHTLGRARRARLWPELKPALVLAHFGQFSTAEHDAALRELLQEGRISCRWSSTAPTGLPGDTEDAQPAERTPGQQDFLEFIETKTRPVWRRS